MRREKSAGPTLPRNAPSHLKRPLIRIQPLLAREGKPSVDVAKLAELIKDHAVLNEMVCIQSPAHWTETIENLPADVDAILPVSSPCYPTEIWNSCPEPLVKRRLPVLFWPLIEWDEPDFWKWSARDFLQALGVEVRLVNSHREGVALLKAMAVKKMLARSRLIVFGEQNFPWNARSGGSLIKASLGTEIMVKPISDIRERYGRYDDAAVDALWRQRQSRYQVESVRAPELKAALRAYLAIRSILEDERALGFGVNCYGDLIIRGGRDVPCLAQSLAREDGFIASCDGDYCAMMSMALATCFLDQPCMMSNMYPLSYVGALKDHFGDSLRAAKKYAPDAENLARLAHCGFVGVVPQDMSPSGKVALKDWGGTYEIKRDGSGCGIDGDLVPGRRFTAIELHFDGKRVLLGTGTVLETTRHKGMPHCESSALLKIDGLRRFVASISREHVVLVYGDHVDELRILCDTLKLDATVIGAQPEAGAHG